MDKKWSPLIACYKERKFCQTFSLPGYSSLSKIVNSGQKKKKKRERERENPMTVSVFERLILVNKWIAIYQPEAEFSRGTSGMFFQVFLDKLDSIAHNHTYS